LPHCDAQLFAGHPRENSVNDTASPTSPATPSASDFIREIIQDDLRSGKHQRVVSRFPPEPNGYLHIGHAKSICLNFGVASEYGGVCHLRFDDTNPTTEDPEFVESIQRDVRWLGAEWGPHLYHASDYFGQLYQFAEKLIEDGNAYVCELSEEAFREYRGTLTEPGRPSPFRDRPAAENLALFRRMRAGEFPDGSLALRAKIDMAAANMKMRDPVIYRIKHAHHYRTGDAWCVYPMYDFAHPLSDAIEKITHSLCTLEFENNRELYDWVVRVSGIDAQPRQIEFARLNLTYTVMSKRKLLRLVADGVVDGWDDPRMPTLSGLRRRGYTADAIRNFAERIGVARTFNVIDVGLLEHSLREDLNAKAPRVLGVLRPLKVLIENYPADGEETFDAPYWPHDVPNEGQRAVPFAREVYIDRDDFELDPPAGFFRLAPGREVRLRYAYVIRCTDVVRDAAGEVVELRCAYDPASRGGATADGRQVKGTIHWVSARHALRAEVRLYDRLFTVERPDADDDFQRHLNPRSLESIEAWVEPSLGTLGAGAHVQLERLGYFFSDPVDSVEGRLVLNRTVTLRDTWAKIAQKPEAAEAARLAAEKAAQRSAHKARQRQATAGEGAAAPALEGATQERFAALRAQGVGEQEARLLALDEALGIFFAAAVAVHPRPVSVANWLAHELQRELKGRAPTDLPFGPAVFGELVALVDGGTLTHAAGKQVLAVLVDQGGMPSEIVERQGLRQIDDEALLAPIIDEVLQNLPGQVESYRQGKHALIGFFQGQIAQRTGGKADPQLVRRLLQARLGA
jgi:glutaminyl-tRNA synthetase